MHFACSGFICTERKGFQKPPYKPSVLKVSALFAVRHQMSKTWERQHCHCNLRPAILHLRKIHMKSQWYTQNKDSAAFMLCFDFLAIGHLDLMKFWCLFVNNTVMQQTSTAHCAGQQCHKADAQRTRPAQWGQSSLWHHSIVKASFCRKTSKSHENQIPSYKHQNLSRLRHLVANEHQNLIGFRHLVTCSNCSWLNL